MAVAPELFDLNQAKRAIEIIEENIRGPLGMKTLDSSDFNYRPNYNNSEDSQDFKTSKGFNYHNGPEWIWCFGYYLRAKIAIESRLCQSEEDMIKLKNEIYRLLQPHKKHIEESYWKGLPELTNENGNNCYDACPTQAWSSATILDALYDSHKLLFK